MATDQGIPIAEFGSLLHLGIEVSQILKGKFADLACMQGGPAANEDDALDFSQVARGGPHAGQHGGTVLSIESTT